MLRSLLGLESYPGTNLAKTATNHGFNMSSPGPLHDSHLGQSWPSGNNQRVSREVPQDSSSEEESSSDSEEDFVTETHQRRKNEDLLSMNSFPETNEDVDPTEEEYFRFLEVTERHRKNRDGDESQTLKKFDFRTDTITDAVLEEGLAMIDTDHEKTKREMEKLYGCRAMKVHSAETKVC